MVMTSRTERRVDRDGVLIVGVDVQGQGETAVHLVAVVHLVRVLVLIDPGNDRALRVIMRLLVLRK